MANLSRNDSLLTASCWDFIDEVGSILLILCFIELVRPIAREMNVYEHEWWWTIVDDGRWKLGKNDKQPTISSCSCRHERPTCNLQPAKSVTLVHTIIVLDNSLYWPSVWALGWSIQNVYLIITLLSFDERKWRAARLLRTVATCCGARVNRLHREFDRWLYSYIYLVIERLFDACYLHVVVRLAFGRWCAKMLLV